MIQSVRSVRIAFQTFRKTRCSIISTTNNVAVEINDLGKLRQMSGRPFPCHLGFFAGRDRFHESCRKHPMNYEYSDKFLFYLRRPHFSIERLHHASHAFLRNLCHNGMNEMGKMSPAISQVQMFCSLSAEKAPTMRCGSWGEIPRKLKLQQIWFLPR